MRGARRWALLGALLGAALSLVAFAPAAWLAAAVAGASAQRVLLAEAQGSVWNGSAVAVLTGGPGSRDASALPGRLHWTLRPQGLGLALVARQDCCIAGELRLLLRPGWGRLRVELPESATPGVARVLGEWPAAGLAGLGTPWNTLQLRGSLRVASPGLVLESVQGRWRVQGRAELTLRGLGSRLSTLDSLGSYRVLLQGADGAAGDAGATVELATLEGALQLSGSGQWVGQRLRFQGQARAAPGHEAVLNNLLNLIGQRQGALAVISIG